MPEAFVSLLLSKHSCDCDGKQVTTVNVVAIVLSACKGAIRKLGGGPTSTPRLTGWEFSQHPRKEHGCWLKVAQHPRLVDIGPMSARIEGGCFAQHAHRWGGWGGHIHTCVDAPPTSTRRVNDVRRSGSGQTPNPKFFLVAFARPVASWARLGSIGLKLRVSQCFGSEQPCR